MEVEDDFGVGPKLGVVAPGAGGGHVRIAMTTTGHNDPDNSPATLAEGVRLEGTGSQAWINTSLMYPAAGYHVSGGASFVSVDCVITSTTTGLPAGATFVSTLDPLYTDLATGDLRPRARIRPCSGSSAPALPVRIESGRRTRCRCW